jgi:NitT/TauT family transport system substrate-binding protein
MQGIRTKVAVALLALGMSAAGMQAASAETLVKWREGIVPFKGDAGFFYMAKEKGFFRKHGIDVEFVQIPGNVKLVRALLAGTVDAIEASPGAMLKAILHGSDIQFIGATLSGLTYAFYVRKDINGWSDLKGKIIGASSPGSVADIFSRVALKNHGVDTKTITISNAGGSSGSYIKALSRGEIAAASASTEFIPISKKLGIKPMTTTAKEAPLYPRLIVASTSTILKARGKETVAKFMAGYMEGLQYALAHRQETIDLTAKLLHKPATTPSYAFLFDEIVEEKDASPTMEVPRKRIEWLEKYMLENKLLKQKVDLDKHIDTSYREEALKLLKK